MSSKSKPKVLIIISSLSKSGGAEKVAYYQSNLKNKFAVNYLTFYSSPSSHMPKVPVMCLNEKANETAFKKTVSRSKAIADYCKKNDVDICISHMEESSIPLLFSRTFGNQAKKIVFVHSNITSHHSRFYLILLSILYMTADKIVGVSRGLLNCFYFKNTIKPRFVSIYNPIALNEINKLSKMKTALNFLPYENMIKVISIGRLDAIKNYSLLLNAVSKLSIPVHCFIIGEGPLKAGLQKQIRTLKLQDKITLLGKIDNVYPYLRQCDIYVSSSLSEGLGISIIEALTVGLPVIAVDCDYGPREILKKKYGILLKNADATGLRSKIQKLADNKTLRRTYANRGIKRAGEFDLKKVISQYETLVSNSL